VMLEKGMKTILVVDDEAVNRFLFANILQAGDRKIVTVADGSEAVVRSQEIRPDMILLDLMMPEVSGFDVLKDLKSNAATRDIPVIVVTAMDDFYAKSRARDAGAVAVLTKPVNRQELVVCTEQLLRSCSPEPPESQAEESDTGGTGDA